MGPMIDTSRLTYSTTTTTGTSATTGTSTICTDCTGITNLTLPYKYILDMDKATLEIEATKKLAETTKTIEATKKLAETAKKIMTEPYYNTFHAYKRYIPKRIIYNDPATVVFWKDGTKTVVKRAPNEVSNHYTAFCAALAKKIFETNSHVNRIVKSGECVEKKTVVKKQEEKKPEPKKLTAKKPVAKKQTDKKKK